jgi:2-haloacid dehalogenase
MIKTVFFDLDDTLFDFKKAEKLAVIKTLSDLGVEPTDYIVSQYSKYNLSQWKRLELGEITRAEVKVNRYRLLFDEIGIDLSPQIATAMYEENLSKGHYFIDGAPEILGEIYTDYDLYLVSNGSKEVQEGRLSGSGISKYFKDIFISETIGADKPNTEFFEYCFSHIKSFDKSNCVIIGDSLTSDVKGGLNVGIKTVWFNPHQNKNTTDIAPDYEIQSLSQIKQLLAEI